jgi:DNA-binding NarL/FixJ family response regulator
MTLPPPSQPGETSALIRLLLADDAPQVLHDLHQLLELTGLIQIVAEARNGQEAVRLAAELSPDAILMDLEMPGMDGYTATHEIKSRLPAPRVVILSVHAGSQERQRAQTAGADEFVVKGASYEVLVNAILGRDVPTYPLNQTKGANA